MLVAVLVVAVIAAAGAAWLQYAARRRRVGALFGIATRAGFEFSERDPHGTVHLPFSLFRKGDGRRVENVMWGTRDKVPTRLFDYWYYDESSDGHGSRSRQYHRFTCALLAIAADCPSLHVTREGLLTRLASAVGFKDVELEYEDFNRRFRVHCDDQKFAFSLLDGKMMEWMMGADGIESLEVVGSLVLIAGPKLSAPDWASLADVGLAFVHHVPHVVLATWPPERTQ